MSREPERSRAITTVSASILRGRRARDAVLGVVSVFDRRTFRYDPARAGDVAGPEEAIDLLGDRALPGQSASMIVLRAQLGTLPSGAMQAIAPPPSAVFGIREI